MLSSVFNKQELTATFDALSLQGQSLIEVALFNPSTLKSEGRGFFNDSDFLCEAANPHLGRFNFGITPFAYAPDRLPSRSSYNQFDRSLIDHNTESSRVHSATLSFCFRPDALRELGAAPDPQQGVVQMAYAVTGILERLGLHSFSLEYNPTTLVVRFLPRLLQNRADAFRSQLGPWTRSFLERVDKEMTPAEHKQFTLAAAALGQVFDPVPGLPGVFNDNKDLITVWSLSPPRPAEESYFDELLDLCLRPTDSRKNGVDVYAPANLQGLSQGWDDRDDEPMLGGVGTMKSTRSETAHAPEAQAFSDRKQQEEVRELADAFQHAAEACWTWPLYSQAFSTRYRGLQCGQVMLMQADPFAGALAFDFLLQCAEPWAKEGKGQVVAFTKKKSAGDLALAALARQYKTHPLSEASQAGRNAAEWARNYAGLFTDAPIFPVCAPNESLESLFNYLDHDFQLRHRRKGGDAPPVAILVDDLHGFRQGDETETYRGLLRLRQKLRDLNATLWITQLVPQAQMPQSRSFLSLADFHARFASGGEVAANDSGAWEKSFALDAALQKALPDLALVRIGFAAQGSHRHYPSAYLYHRPTCLYKEIAVPS